MSEMFRLPARVQPQVWVRNNAVDAGDSIPFDAHSAMLGLDSPAFRRVSEQILGTGHDYDELALASGAIRAWVGGGKDNTFVVTVDDGDFVEWLEAVGLTGEEARQMDDGALSSLRARAAALPPLGAGGPHP